MGTPVIKVFNKFLGSIDDKEWLQVEDDIIEELMIEYLESATVDFTQCRKDLSFIPPENGEIEIVTDGLTNQVLFDPSGDHRIPDILNIVSVDTGITYFPNTDYTYQNKTINFIDPPTENLIIKYHIEGEFKSELDSMEIRILAHAMMLHYLKPKIMTQDSLKQYVSDKDFTKLSGANMLLRLIGLEKSQQKQLDILQSRYSFREFEGWN